MGRQYYSICTHKRHIIYTLKRLQTFFLFSYRFIQRLLLYRDTTYYLEDTSYFYYLRIFYKFEYI